MPSTRACRMLLRTPLQASQKHTRGYTGTTACLLSNDSTPSSRLPRVANPSFWAGLIPSFLRRPASAEQAIHRAQVRDAGASERRVGLVFLFLGILVGSNAINIISIQRDLLNFTRHTDAKLELLREVVQKVKNGQDVDVQAALGTGNADQEKQWEQMINELETTDMLSQGRKRREAKRAQKAAKAELGDKNATNTSQDSASDSSLPDEQHQQRRSSKFLM